MKDLTQKLSEETALHEEIKHLQALLSESRSQLDLEIRRLSGKKLSASESKESQKRYLWTKYIVIPELFKLIRAKCIEFKTNYQEEIPLKIDADFIKAHFKEANPS